MYHAKLILGSYRADEANDPKIYVTAISHLLSRYPRDIGARLTDPKDGVAGKYKWLPSVSEVKEEADRLTAADLAASKRRHSLKEQWELRDRMESEEKTEPLEHRQKVAQRILKEYHEAIAAHKGEPFNVFVPTYAPQYADMVAKGGKPGVSLQDKSRAGVWVPHRWVSTPLSKNDTWKQFSTEELQAQYPSEQFTDDELRATF